MHSTRAGRVGSSGFVDIFRSKSVNRLERISDDDKLMRGVGELNTDAIMAVRAVESGRELAVASC
jgi:hypothetical protein